MLHFALPYKTRIARQRPLSVTATTLHREPDVNPNVDDATVLVTYPSPYERENNREKSVAGNVLAKQQGRHLGWPAVRDAQELAKVAKALEEGLPVT